MKYIDKNGKIYKFSKKEAKSIQKKYRYADTTNSWQYYLYLPPNDSVYIVRKLPPWKWIIYVLEHKIHNAVHYFLYEL